MLATFPEGWFPILWESWICLWCETCCNRYFILYTNENCIIPGRNLFCEQQQIILKMLKQLWLSTMRSWIIHWKDCLQSASTHHMKDVAAVAAFYNMNLYYLSEGPSSVRSIGSHETCCTNHLFLQLKLGLFHLRIYFGQQHHILKLY